MRSAVGSASDSRIRGSGFYIQSATYFCFSFCFKKGSCQLLAKVDALGNRLGGLSLSRDSVVMLTDSPNIIIDFYRGRKDTKKN